MLAYKCLLYGKELVFLDERDTTKTCHCCGNKQSMPLWVRTYRCKNCGLVMDRDENSAHNILMRFLARLGPSPVRSFSAGGVFPFNNYLKISKSSIMKSVFHHTRKLQKGEL